MTGAVCRPPQQVLGQEVLPEACRESSIELASHRTKQRSICRHRNLVGTHACVILILRVVHAPQPLQINQTLRKQLSCLLVLLLPT